MPFHKVPGKVVKVFTMELLLDAPKTHINKPRQNLTEKCL